MEVVFNIILCILLAILVVQDFRYRAVHIIVLLGTFGASMGISWYQRGELFNVIHQGYVIIIVISLWLYCSIRQRRNVNPFIKHMGIGDVAFLFAVTPLFSHYNFVLFITSGLLLTIILALLFRRTITRNAIPTAGILSCYLLTIKLFSYTIGHDIFYYSFINL